MKNLRELDAYRISSRVTHGWDGDETCGSFVLPSPIDGQPLRIVASCGDGWDHVSVSRSNRCPNWPEMDFIKRRFFKGDEIAMQLHVPVSDHINVHPNCLHLWRPQASDIPRPPGWMVGPSRSDVAPDVAPASHPKMKT